MGQLRTPPGEAVFLTDVIKGKQSLYKYISRQQANEAWKIFKKHKCESSVLIVYFKEGAAEKLVVFDCKRVLQPKTSEYEEVIDIEFPIMVSAGNSGVHELSNLLDYGFMYGTGELKAVTDLNHNGHVELWLDGSVCECDGEYEENEPCECAGTSVVENIDGRLRVYRPASAVKRAPRDKITRSGYGPNN